LAALITLAALLPSTASAVTYTWTQNPSPTWSGTYAWSTGTNWLGSTVPTSVNDTRIEIFPASTGFPSTSGTLTSNVDLGTSGTFTLNRLVWNGTATASSGTGSTFLLTGNTLNLAGTAPRIESSSAGTGRPAFVINNSIVINETTLLLRNPTTSSQVFQINGAISGDGGVSTNQGGWVDLTGTNTFTGNVNLGLVSSGGGLRIRGSGLLGSGTYSGNINSNVLGTGAGQTLVWDSTAFQSLTGTFTSTAGNEGLLVNAGTVSLDGTMSAYNGNMRANGGVIRLGSAGALGTTTGTLTIGTNNSSVVDLNGYSVVGESATLSGGSLSNLAVGTTSTWTGSVFSSQNSTITTGGTAANSAASIALPNGLQGGVGNVTKEGSGSLVVTGSLGAPQMRINLGTLRLTAPGTIMTSSGTFTTNSSNQANFTPTLAFGQSGTYGFNAWLISNGNFTTDSGTAVATFATAGLGGSATKTVQVDANTSVTVSGTTDLLSSSTSSRGLTVRGAGDLTFSGAVTGSTGTTSFSITKSGTAASQTGTLTLSSANSYNGTTTVEAGTLKIGNASSLGSTGPAAGTAVQPSTVAGLVGTLDLNGQSVSAESLTLTGTNTNNTTGTGAYLVNNNSGRAASWAGSVTVSGGTVGIGGPGDLSLTGAVDGTGSVVKTGAGMLTLTNANTYTGATTVNVGGLVLNGSLAVGSNLSVAAAAWLGGTGTAPGIVTVGGTLSPGNSPGVITLGSLVLTSTSVTAIEVASAGTRGTAYDGVSILNASGLTYGGTLAFAFGGSAIADNTELEIFSFTGSAAGDFATLVSTGFYAGNWTNNNDGTFTLAKDAQTLTFRESTGRVIVVPEPGTALLGVLGALAALVSRRGMRRRPFACGDRA
jgi:autotransporter-associated beta strand protein